MKRSEYTSKIHKRLTSVVVARALRNEFPKMSLRRIARLVGCSKSSLIRWCIRYEFAGLDALSYGYKPEIISVVAVPEIDYAELFREGLNHLRTAAKHWKDITFQDRAGLVELASKIGEILPEDVKRVL